MQATEIGHKRVNPIWFDWHKAKKWAKSINGLRNQNTVPVGRVVTGTGPWGVLPGASDVLFLYLWANYIGVLTFWHPWFVYISLCMLHSNTKFTWKRNTTNCCKFLSKHFTPVKLTIEENIPACFILSYLVNVIWNIWYPAIKEANLERLCFPEPPTPTSNAFPHDVRIIREICFETK